WGLAPPSATLFPCTTLFRSVRGDRAQGDGLRAGAALRHGGGTRRRPRTLPRRRARARAPPRSARARVALRRTAAGPRHAVRRDRDRKSTRLNSSHVKISYAV